MTRSDQPALTLPTDTPPRPPPGPYEEKFHALREQLDAATAVRRAQEDALAAAQAKQRSLQAECDMLLDTIAASQPALTQYFERSPAYAGANGHPRA